jgi:glyoxylate reductase
MQELSRRFTVKRALDDRPLSREQLLAQVHEADALAVTLADTVDVEVFNHAPRLKIVAVYAVGYNNVDVSAATARGIVVTNTPDVLTESTADLTWGLILSVARRLFPAEHALREGRWDGWAPTQFLGTDVHERVLGIVGMGRIGQAVARRALGFGMPVIYASRTSLSAERERSLNTRRVLLADLLKTADFVSIHVPLTPDTHHLIGRGELALMRPTSYLINTSRGAVVDESALADVLAVGRLAGAGLDVYENEPRVHPQLLGLPNVVLLPHLGSATHETRIKMGMMVVENISAVLGGKDAPNRVQASTSSRTSV